MRPRRSDQALQRTVGNVARAARLLGISRGALRHRMARYGIAPSSHEGTVVLPSRQSRAERADGTAVRQDDRQGVPLRRESLAPASSWEQKPVAVLAVEVTWPAGNEGEGSRYEPWTVTSHWGAGHRGEGHGLRWRGAATRAVSGHGRLRRPADAGAGAAARGAGGAGGAAPGGGSG